MKHQWYVICALLLPVVPAQGVVFMNEIFINPQGSFDDSTEFIELAGTPGKSLDGYAIALLNGMETRYFAEGSALPDDLEIDEFFSLDGLSLGTNGLLVIGVSIQDDYSTVVADTNFHSWSGDANANPPQAPLWNGGLDTPGNLQNDGSNTILLLRNRPGRTQADPTNPGGLRWGKDIDHDQDFQPHVEDPQTPPPPYFDQWGNGSIDQGDTYGVCDGGDDEGLPCDNGCPNGTCKLVVTQDHRGSSTPGAESPEVDDDLEIVDEVSYEHERGWEYDLDDRFVDCGACQGGDTPGAPCEDDGDCPNGGTCAGESTLGGLECRRVHALDDPQGFNSDVLTRVDYRTKGAGWTPASGAYGAYPPEAPAATRTNWQDTATEQWIRGESVLDLDEFFNFLWFYDNTANANEDAIQPYLTNVPLWLDDGSGTDYDFSTTNTYEIKAGQINDLAIPFIPGDSDRDGDCDADDIAKVAAVFGNEDWIFSNSYGASPQGDDVDPATQTRPWDVDATGDNGIEASDLQWSLNFQGDTAGKVVGVTYDASGAAASGVVLNPNTGVECTVTVATNVPSGRTLSTLRIGDLVELTVSAEVTQGANTTANAENGIMQFVNDVVIDSAGVARVKSVEALGSFATTRSGIQELNGSSGDLGMSNVNGYSTSFTEGLSGASAMYLVTLQASGLGGPVDVSIVPAAESKFAASTPEGLKVGHTTENGNPASSVYTSASATLTVIASVPPDQNGDGDVDQDDIDTLALCGSGPEVPFGPGCDDSDFDGDGDVDQVDFSAAQRCISGEGLPVDPDCYP